MAPTKRRHEPHRTTALGRLIESEELGAHRELSIGEARRSAFILEDVVDVAARETGYEYLRSLPYQLIDSDREDTRHVLHWVRHFDAAEIERSELLRRVVERAQTFLERRGLEPTGLDRAYANFNLFGDFQFAHRDGNGWTALFFANSHWGADWGGELFLYGEDPDIAVAVQPRPGRLVIFDGLIQHRGGTPSKLCLEPRISIAMKFKRSRARSTR